MFGRQKVAAIVAEFLGTAVLAAGVLAMIERTSFPFFAAVIAGFVAGGWWLMFGESSGAYLNPALTLGMWTVRKIKTTEAVVFVAAQMLGGLVAWRVVEYFQNSSLQNIAGKNYDTRILLAEALGTAIFVLGVSAAVHKGYEGYRKAATIGGALALGVIMASFAGNGLVNPAVAVGVHSFSFSYVVGPLVGAVLGANLYILMFTDNVVRRRVTAPVKVAAASSAASGKKSAKKTRKTAKKRR